MAQLGYSLPRGRFQFQPGSCWHRGSTQFLLASWLVCAPAVVARPGSCWVNSPAGLLLVSWPVPAPAGRLMALWPVCDPAVVAAGPGSCWGNGLSGPLLASWPVPSPTRVEDCWNRCPAPTRCALAGNVVVVAGVVPRLGSDPSPRSPSLPVPRHCCRRPFRPHRGLPTSFCQRRPAKGGLPSADAPLALATVVLFACPPT